MNNFKFVAGINSELAKKLSDLFDKSLNKVEINHFADSETFIKPIEPENFKDLKNVFVINQFYFSNKSVGLSFVNNQFFDFLFLIDFLKKLNTEKIVAFLPYLPYSRQDKSSYDDSIGSISLVSKFLKTAGVNKLIVCEFHSPEIINKLDLEIENIDFSPFWFDFLKSNVFTKLINNDFSSVCFVAPDEGAKLRNQKLSDNTGSTFAFIKKTRTAADTPVALSLHGDVKDKTVIMVDDIIDTGRTAIKASELILKHGAKKVIGCFTHAVLSFGAASRIDQSSFDHVFITDTILIDRTSLSKKFFIVSVDKFLSRAVSHDPELCRGSEGLKSYE